MSKHTKFRSLMSILYALIMLLPLTSVAFRCFYTIFNKNAYESYSQQEVVTNYKYETNDVSVSNDLVIGRIYHCSIPLATFNTWSNDEFFRNSDFIYIETYEYGTIYYNMFENHLSKSGENSVSYRATVYDQNQTVRNMFSYGFNPSYYGTNVDFDFVYTSNSVSYVANLINFISASDYNEIVSYDINKTGYLDNAFEYSLNEFVGNNGRGVLNLTDWFTNVFLQSSTHTQLYLDFINWYMNYTLLVSCVYILYLVLMWFVSLARRLLTNMIEKGGELK